MDELELKTHLEENHSKSFVWAMSCCSQDPLEAEDTLQTVYLKILEGRAKYKGKSAFKTWLFAVIRNTAVDLQRRKRVRQLGLISYGETIVDETSVEKNEPSQTLAHFEKALGELSQRQQQILELVFYHDVTLEQAAEVMGISVGSVRTHYHRGKKRIRHLMGKSETLE